MVFTVGPLVIHNHSCLIYTYIKEKLENTITFGDKSRLGRGDMTAKVKAAVYASQAGIPVVITMDNIVKVLRGQRIGTLFHRDAHMWVPSGELNALNLVIIRVYREVTKYFKFLIQVLQVGFSNRPRRFCRFCKRRSRLNQLKDLLNDAIKERDEAHSKNQSLLLDYLFLQQQFHHHRRCTHRQTNTPPPQSGISSIEDEPITNCGFSSSDCEESIVSSPPIENPGPLPPPPPQQELRFPVVPSLAGKGEVSRSNDESRTFVTEPPPRRTSPTMAPPSSALDTYQIPSPPLVISAPTSHHLFNQDFLRKITNNCGEFNSKRRFSEDCDSSAETKYQRISLN